MSRSLAKWTAAALSAIAVAAPLGAHDDDPKLLDVEAPWTGPGFRGASLSEVGGSGTQFGSTSLHFPANGVKLLAWLSLNELDDTATSVNDVWGYVSPSGREYALVGSSSKTIFVEVTDPDDPQIIKKINGPDGLWRDIKVYADHAYAVSESGSGIQVMDMSQIDSGTVTLVDEVDDVGTGSTHNVAVDEVSGYLYRCGGSNNGLRIYDLSDPAQPAFAGQWNARYVHDAQIVTYTTGPLAGKEIAYCCAGLNGGWSQTGLTILDVTNKQNIQTLSQVYYPQPGYSHQGWLSEDRQYFYLGDELDEDGSLPTTTHVIDVSDPSSASYVGSFTNENQAIGHNLYTKGDLIFEANYRSGLRIFDASADATAPVEIASFDTNGVDDLDAFNGLWSVYPYLPSEAVLGSDRELGLFLWWVGSPLLDFDFPTGVPETIAPGGDALIVEILESLPGLLVPGTEKLVYDDGVSVPKAVPLVPLGGGFYDAHFPAFPCATDVSWYVTAETTNDIAWSSPQTAPVEFHLSVAAQGTTVALVDDMEAGGGWTAGTPFDDAGAGIWVHGDPTGTAAQPEDDHTPGGTDCWYTGASGDVDGGQTTLLSPVMDLSQLATPVISYWRWFSNGAGAAPHADVLEVDVSDDGGLSWTRVEVVGPVGPEADGGWFQHTFSLEQFATATAEVRLRFVAADEYAASLVEAAIDDLTVTDYDCQSCISQRYCTAEINSTGLAARIDVGGSLNVNDNDFQLVTTFTPAFQNSLYFYGAAQTEVPFGNGNLCISGSFHRLDVISTEDIGPVYPVDFTNPPSAAGQVTPGSTWNFQLWFRDPAAGGAAFNLSDAVQVVFCP